MTSSQWYGLGLLTGLILLIWLLQPNESPQLQGTVVDTAGPVAGATVREQGSSRNVCSDEQGRFRLPLELPTRPITASKAGFRIGSAPASQRPLTVKLDQWPRKDSIDYAWIDPHPDPHQTNNCGNCHGEIYREWKGSAHANSATNRKFLALFAGQGGATPNVETEYPDGAGVCATCHAPTLRSLTLDYDVRTAEGAARSGVHCDYCHKVVDAPTDKLGIRFGRDGLTLLRPPANDLLSFGPLDDAVRPGESFGYLPLYKQSRYCASCHEGTVFGVHVYGTYSEWLESPARKEGKQCQDCHMASTGRMTNIAPGKGGIQRDPSKLASHTLPGGERDMLRRCLKVDVQTRTIAEGFRVEVTVRADQVGHRVPTGFVDRHLLLVVEAVNAAGKAVALLTGPRLPASAGRWQGFPGTLYAKQLFDDKGQTPTPFWRHVDRIEDTRLHPRKADCNTFVFGGSTEVVTIQLWYRRFWQATADPLGWRDNDVLFVERKIRP